MRTIRMALATVLNRFLPGLGVLIAGALTTLLAARLSRQDEFEADAYAAEHTAAGHLVHLHAIRRWARVQLDHARISSRPA